MAANLAALMPEPSKAASISCRLTSGVSTRPRLSYLRISPPDNNEVVDVIASTLRHLRYLRQAVLHATLTEITIIAAEEKVEREERYNRSLAFESFTVQFTARR